MSIKVFLSLAELKVCLWLGRCHFSIYRRSPVLKSPKGKWGELFSFDNEGDEGFMEPLDLEGQEGEGVMFLEEAHEALNKLSQKTNKRGRLMKQPRRAES